MRATSRSAASVPRMTAARAAARAWRSYRGSGLRLRAFLLARLAVLPLPGLARELRALDGRVLGVGSGHGLIERWLCELNPRVTADATDLDTERVAVARRSAASAPRVRSRVQDVRALEPADPYDALLVVDLLHHVPLTEQASLAEAFARALRPGGVLLVKDIARTPRLKERWNALHDRLVTGEWLDNTRDPGDWAALFDHAGFAVERSYRLGRLGPYPHFMLRLRRASGRPR